ncbi:hypothetical protein EYC80_006709 [Monilinia laxa]|uniref:DUF967 domain protein n=1 Tax=Monilinia laxa TaxID=61186 RepID=A0A5N6JZC2_MONLA|nr:hypothetical protein EYC80_006709 [Monilinia laxa]
MVNVALSLPLSPGMSPSSPTSNAFCGLGHRPSHSNHLSFDAHSTTSSQFRNQVVLNARPLLLRRKDSTTSTRSHTSSKSQKSDSHSHSHSRSSSHSQSHDKSSANHSSSSNTSTSHPPPILPPRNLKLKKSQPPGSSSPNFSLPLNNNNPKRRSADFQWARDDQLSVILEYLEERSSSTPNSESADPFNNNNNNNQPPLAIPETIRENQSPTPTSSSSPRTPKFNKIGVRERASNSRIPSYGYIRYCASLNLSNNSNNHNNNDNNTTIDATTPQYLTRSIEERELEFRDITREKEDQDFSSSALGIRMSSSVGGGERMTPEVIPRPISHPPKDLESIARIDSSLIFEHFTTSDAWVLGSALRERLLPHPTPVVISISLSNANQILFHCCTHSGTMPDNDSWVSRKRKTVLRWGVSTWYMWCKFEGDESAFARKYGLGGEGGEYAIHGGGVPIRVTGVEGVVAVVVVSGLKQWEDHGVIVEVIRDLYY